MCDNFTPQQDRIILYAIGQLVSSNQLLCLTPNQKPYAGTTALYEGSNGLVSKPVLHLKLDKQGCQQRGVWKTRIAISLEKWRTVENTPEKWFRWSIGEINADKFDQASSVKEKTKKSQPMFCVSYPNKQQSSLPFSRCCEVDCDKLGTKFLSFFIILTPICHYLSLFTKNCSKMSWSD